MLNFIGQNPQNKGFNFGHCLLARSTICHGTGNHGDFRDPSTILLLFYFNAHAG